MKRRLREFHGSNQQLQGYVAKKKPNAECECFTVLAKELKAMVSPMKLLFSENTVE